MILIFLTDSAAAATLFLFRYSCKQVLEKLLLEPVTHSRRFS